MSRYINSIFSVCRSEKTEVLSDDLQTAEKRVELLKQVSSNTYKKLSSSLLVANTSASDADKILVSLAEIFSLCL